MNTQIHYTNLAKLISLLLILIFICYLFFTHLFPFAISILLALVLHPLVKVTEHFLHLPKNLAIVIVILSFTLTFLSISSLVLIETFHWLQNISTLLPHLIEQLTIKIQSFQSSLFSKWSEWMDHTAEQFDPQSKNLVASIIDALLEHFKSTSEDTVANLSHQVITWLTAILRGGYYSLFILISTFFLLKDGPTWLSKLSVHIPSSFRDSLLLWKNNIYVMFKKYVASQVLIATITAFLIFITLQIINTNHVITITFLAILFDLIPVIGIGLLFFPWIIYTLIAQDHLMTIQLCSLYIFVVIVRNLIEPRLIGGSIGIHPLALVVGIFITLKVFGPTGVLVTPFILMLSGAFLKSGGFSHIKKYILK
ncbi:AI-2E family transporter [Halalkalibacillus sediminis]|uniref:AI-2E family transporter n=1 Tax=Halalkalibacillus sediminis TaxID=2018042 RepID=UPI0013902A46|nr:AI-2E family transporter [Halalkalibacillus sediminis]